MLALLTEEQELLVTTVRSMNAVLGVAGPRELDEFDDQRAWATLVEAGLLGLRVRSHGEPLGSGVDAMLVARGLGEMLCPAPFVPALLATELLALAGAGDDLAEAIAAGEQRAAILLRPDLTDLADVGDLTSAVRWGVGNLGLCLGSQGALMGVPLRSVGSAARTIHPLDASPLGEGPVLPDGSVPSDGSVQPGGPVAEGGFAAQVGGRLGPAERDRWLALALTLVGADVVGAGRAAVDGVIAYTKSRVAFGVPIGSFQAIQHLCADAVVAWEAADSALGHAAWAVDELDPAGARMAASTAKAWLGLTARDAVETVMQVYGGIGQTWEHPAHLHTRRVLAGISLLGDGDAQLDHLHAARSTQRQAV